jgi:hypothetical protein
MSVTIGYAVLTMIGFTLILYLIHEFFRRFLIITSLIFLIALFSFPCWKSTYTDWFLIAKTLLMIISIIIINIARLGYSFKKFKLSLLQSKLPFWLIYLALTSNILVAFLPDFGIGNYSNALTGLLLCITVPLPPKGWRIDLTRFKNHDLFVDLPILWCLLYFSWWMSFIYGSWPDIFYRAICLMLVTLVPIILYKSTDLWLSIRAYTLVLYLLSIALFDYTIPYIDTAIRFSRDLLISWGILNGITAITYSLFWFVYSRKKYNEKYADQAYNE